MSALAAITVVEAQMVAVLGELHLTGLVTTIPGLSAVGAAAILARDRRPGPLRQRPHLGQARRSRAAGE
jgi:hypothetical protein